MLEPSSEDVSYAGVPQREARKPLRLSVFLWLLGLPGVVAMASQVGRRMYQGALPEWVLPLVGGAQAGLLLAAAAFLGARLSPRLGLGAPVLAAWVERRAQAGLALQHMWLPGIGLGVLGAAWMVSLAQLTPEGLAPGDPVQMLPLWAKLLYGGITEELLLRWGALNVLLFAMWRVVQPHGGEPRRWLVWVAILLSGVLSAALALPLSMAMGGGLTASLLGYVLLNYTVFGLLAGYIYWRHGLGATIVGHTLALALSHGLT